MIHRVELNFNYFDWIWCEQRTRRPLLSIAFGTFGTGRSVIGTTDRWSKKFQFEVVCRAGEPWPKNTGIENFFGSHEKLRFLPVDGIKQVETRNRNWCRLLDGQDPWRLIRLDEFAWLLPHRDCTEMREDNPMSFGRRSLMVNSQLTKTEFKFTKFNELWWSTDFAWFRNRDDPPALGKRELQTLMQKSCSSSLVLISSELPGSPSTFTSIKFCFSHTQEKPPASWEMWLQLIHRFSQLKKSSFRLISSLVGLRSWWVYDFCAVTYAVISSFPLFLLD